MSERPAVTVYFAYDNIKGCFMDVPGWRPGGAPIALHALATEVARDPDYDVRALVRGDVPDHAIDGVRLVSRRDPIQRGVPFVSRLLNRRRARKPFSDASRPFITVTSVALYSYLPMIQSLTHSLGGKIIYRIAADFDLRPEEREPDPENRFIDALLSCDAVVAQTMSQAQDLRARYGREARIILPSVRIPSLRPTVDKDSVLWVGQSYAVKRPWLFLDLAASFPEQLFVMVCPNVDSELWESTRRRAEATPNVEFIESVPPTEIQRYFDRALVVVNTSSIEGFPNTFHQAGIGQAPVLSLAWNADDHIGSYGLGLHAGDDMGLMTEQLATLLSDDEMRRVMGEAGRAHVERFHSVEQAARDYKTLFEELLGFRPASTRAFDDIPAKGTSS